MGCTLFSFTEQDDDVDGKDTAENGCEKLACGIDYQAC